MPVWIVAAALLLLLAGACTSASEDDEGAAAPEDSAVGDSSDDDSTTDDSTDADGELSPGDDQGSAEPPSLDDRQLAERLADLPGRLAVGNGPELAVARPDGGRLELLDGGDEVVAGQPTWSADGGRLAWASLSVGGQQIVVQDYGDDGLRAGPAMVAAADGTPIFYLQWSDPGDRLAYIRNSLGGGGVEVGVARPGVPIDPVGSGLPFYVSWAPSGSRLLGHVDEASITMYDAAVADERGFIAVADVAGGFSAPAWVDDERALIVADGALAYLDVVTGEVEPILEVGGPIRFVLSPDGRRVAYRLLAGGEGAGSPEVALGVRAAVADPVPAQGGQGGGGELLVLDLDTGEQTVVTPEVSVAWEWRPDSGGLAWLGIEVEGGGVTGTWNFWSVDGDQPATAATPGFGLTRKHLQAYLPFFAQYAQSVTGWSPDSSAFAFAGRLDGRRGVWVQLIDERVEPRLVAPGDFVTWGPGQAPPPSNAASAA